VAELPGIPNPAGNLLLHLEGNLREYIGRQLGHVSYGRNRPQEFKANNISIQELLRGVTELKALIPSIIESLSQEAMESEYPEIVLGKALSTHAFLISRYGHLNWHLGQLDYLRRILAGEGAGAIVPVQL